MEAAPCQVEDLPEMPQVVHSRGAVRTNSSAFPFITTIFPFLCWIITFMVFQLSYFLDIILIQELSFRVLLDLSWKGEKRWENKYVTGAPCGTSRWQTWSLSRCYSPQSPRNSNRKAYPKTGLGLFSHLSTAAGLGQPFSTGIPHASQHPSSVMNYLLFSAAGIALTVYGPLHHWEESFTASCSGWNSLLESS